MNKPVRIASEVLLSTVGFVVVTAGVYMPFVIADANKHLEDKCDYLLILGGDIIGPDKPSPQLFERMKKAAEYLNKYPDVTAIPCGGCFREGQKKSEAQIIADYLVENGVSPDRIVLEDKSTTTFENFGFGLEILKKLTGKNIDELDIGFLSSTYHIHRAGVISKHFDIKNVKRVSCVTPGKAFKRFIREYFVGYDLAIRCFTGREKR